MGKILISTGGRIFFSLILSLVMSCSNQVNVDTVEVVAADVLSLIISDEEFHQYLHLELPERNPILIATNDKVSNNTHLSGYDVVLHSEKVSELYIELIKFELGGDKVEFEVKYEIEGVTFQGVAARVNKRWILQNKIIFES